MRGIAPLVLSLICIIFLFLVAFTGTWYGSEYEQEKEIGTEGISFDYRVSVDADYDLSDEAEIKLHMEAEEYDIEEEEEIEGGVSNDVEGINTLTRILLILSIVFILVFIILAILGMIRLIPGWIPGIVGIVAALVILSGIAYYAAAMPSAFEKEMDEELEESSDTGIPSLDEYMVDLSNGVKENGHFGWAFYTALITGLFFIFLPVIFFSMKRRKFYFGSEWSNTQQRAPIGYNYPNYRPPAVNGPREIPGSDFGSYNKGPDTSGGQADLDRTNDPRQSLYGYQYTDQDRNLPPDGSSNQNWY